MKRAAASNTTPSVENNSFSNSPVPLESDMQPQFSTLNPYAPESQLRPLHYTQQEDWPESDHWQMLSNPSYCVTDLAQGAPLCFLDLTGPNGHYDQQHYIPNIWVYTLKEREHHTCKTLQEQIEHYFSDANLVKDTLLKSNMDNEGWVSVDLISGFPRVKRLKQDKILILKSVQPSNVVEVQGNKMRRRGNWMDWISPHGSSISTHLTTDKQVTSTQKLKLDGDSCEIDAQEEIKQNIGTANGGNEGA